MCGDRNVTSRAGAEGKLKGIRQTAYTQVNDWEKVRAICGCRCSRA